MSAAGFGDADVVGEFTTATERAVTSFQRAAGLRVDGECGVNTWSALVESGYSLGDRLLCLRSPMMRGDDVGELQLRLGTLGFDAGRVDGIFGLETQQAVGEFQRNAGLVSDEVCGPETVATLQRLEGRGGTGTVIGVRERDRLRRRASERSGLRVATGSAGPLHPLATALAAELGRNGTSSLVLDGTWSEQATACNDYGADVYIGIILVDGATVETAYFSTPGYESHGGRCLAERIVEELPAAPGWGVGSVKGMRLPILRETRAPAVVLTLGPGPLVHDNVALVVAALHRALDVWSMDPVPAS